MTRSTTTTERVDWLVGFAITSWARTTSRCAAEYLGLQVVRVSQCPLIGPITDTLVGATTKTVMRYVHVAGLKGDRDRITNVHRLWYQVEGAQPGRPVAGDGGVAGLAGQGRPDVVPGALFETLLVGPLNDDIGLDVGSRYGDAGDGRPERELRRPMHRDRCGRLLPARWRGLDRRRGAAERLRERGLGVFG